MDSLVTEMLAQLNLERKHYLRELLSRMAQGYEIRPEAWTKIYVALIEKKDNIKLLKDLRPIAIMSCVHKLYMKLWMARSAPWIEPRLSGTFGVRKNYLDLDMLLPYT